MHYIDAPLRVHGARGGRGSLCGCNFIPKPYKARVQRWAGLMCGCKFVPRQE